MGLLLVALINLSGLAPQAFKLCAQHSHQPAVEYPAGSKRDGRGLKLVLNRCKRNRYLIL